MESDRQALVLVRAQEMLSSGYEIGLGESAEWTANRLDQRLTNQHPLLACYFALGDPLFSAEVLTIYQDCGIDIIELGIPSSNPFLDGADVASAMRRSVDSGTDPYRRMAEIIDWIHDDGTRPAGVCMAYADFDADRISLPMMDRLDGFLFVDPDKKLFLSGLEQRLLDHGSRRCGFVALDHSPADIDAAGANDGYVMVQASPGVTGPRPTIDVRLEGLIARLRGHGVDRPILAGFGIGNAGQAGAAVGMGADGVVIGSICIRKLREGPAALGAFLSEVRTTLNAS